jgi:tetratricopeptide (TPR) repeat protein
MTFSVGVFRTTLFLLASLALSGCLDSTQSQMDEEKESHFLMGKSRVSAMDYPAAIESFEKALEVNPRSAAAHLELACLYENRELDPAAAIYHYQQYLKFRPNAENTDIVNQRILAMKQELVKTVWLGPVTERQQREFERLVEENKRLNDELEKWRAYATRLQALTNPPSPALTARQSQPVTSVTPLVANPGSSNLTTIARSSVTPVASPRTHIVQAGETLSIIARKYRVRLEALKAANPRLDPRRMRVGQTLIIPSGSS